MESTIDRLAEAHWYIHEMEIYYHFADPFRWSFNGFIRSLKEIPQIMQMELQNATDFNEWFHPKRIATSDDPLISHLATARNTIVHKKMLKPASEGWIGITEGRGMKFGIGIPIDPLEDSDDAIQKFLGYVAHNGDTFGFLEEDEESLPCVQRSWRLKQFPDEDLVDIAAKAWQITGQLVSEAMEWIGASPLNLDLSCRHTSNRVQIRTYERPQLNLELQRIRADSSH